MRIELKRVDDDFQMEARDENGHAVSMDAGENIGGHNRGVRPMQMLLMGLGGCSAVDILLILKKQKQEVSNFRIQIDGEREQGREPSLWEQVNLVFYFEGKVDPEKAQRAVDLSMKKYCSVAATLEKAGTRMNYSVKVIPS
ncbi:MAG TPA: OsmC family protein [Bacteroidia bacterium]|nr:OsmC family protein [Bacteroidia bacterium]